MFCLLPTLWKQQQIAILIISFFLYVKGIRNEGNNMLQQQQQQQQQQQPEPQHSQSQSHQQQQQLQPLHATIKNSNYQRPSTSPNSVFKPSPLVEFTLADATIYKPTYNEPPTSPATSSIEHDATADNIKSAALTLTTKTKDQHDNRRYSTTSANGETKFLFPNDQQQVYPIPQQQQQQQQEQEQPYQQQQHSPYQQQQPTPQHFTEMPIYIYRDPYTNENYHYTPTEPTILEAGPQSSETYTTSHNDNAANGYKHQQQQQLQVYQPATQSHNSQEYLVHSSMTVGSKPPPYTTGDKDIYLKRPGLVYDESYIPHPNAVVEKKRDSPQITKTNKISYDSHDYPPPSYAQQQTSNFLPTPVPDRPPISRPTQQQPPSPVRRPLPAYNTASSPYAPPRQDYRPRPHSPPPPPAPPSNQEYTFDRPQYQQQQQQYLQSSQNALPNYANNLDNYLSNKQQGPYYQTERPPPSYVQQQPSHYETGAPSPVPSYRPPIQHQQSPYPAYESPQYHQQPSPHPSHRPSYNNYYDYQIGEVPPQSQGAVNYPYPRPPNGPYRPPSTPQQQQQPSGLASLVQYAPQFTSLLLGGVGGGGGGSSSNSNSPLGSLLGALTGAGNAQQTSSPSSSSFNRRPINAQLIRALENIAHNDDLQCVPKVVCQMIAAQTQRGQLPSFITSPAITNFLAGFPAASPALIYGRAALLGISGGDKSCHQTYMKCPKNEVEIIYYLNNHRGGFFKFFSEPETEQPQTQHNQDSPQTSLFSILAALTGNQQVSTPTTPRPRPRPKPQPADSSDITSTIGNFFTNLLSDYMGEGATVEYQRSNRNKRSAERRVRFINSNEDDHYEFNLCPEDYNDEEDSEDTQPHDDVTYPIDYSYSGDADPEDSDIQSRVIPKLAQNESRIKFISDQDNIAEGNSKISQDFKTLIQRFNEFNKGRKLKFPKDSSEQRQYTTVKKEFVKESKGLNAEDDRENYSQQYTNYEAETFKTLEDLKTFTFPDDGAGRNSYPNKYLNGLSDLSMAASSYRGSKMVFPQPEGRILNHQYYADSYSYHQQNPPRAETADKFVLPNSQVNNNVGETSHQFVVPNSPINNYGQTDKFVLPNSQISNYEGSSHQFVAHNSQIINNLETVVPNNPITNNVENTPNIHLINNGESLHQFVVPSHQINNNGETLHQYVVPTNNQIIHNAESFSHFAAPNNQIFHNGETFPQFVAPNTHIINTGETANKFLVSNNQRLQEHYYDLFAPQKDYLHTVPSNQITSSPQPLYSQAHQGYNQVTTPGESIIFNNHVSSLNSNYVSNTATSHNNYYGLPLNQGEFKPPASSNNYFLPTPAPETDVDYTYLNTKNPSNKLHNAMKYYNQITTRIVENLNKYSEIGANTFNFNSNSYKPLKNPSSSSSSSSAGGNVNYNKENSYGPVRKPSHNTSPSSSYITNSSNGNYDFHRFSSGINTLNSNSYAQNNRYHSSLYTTRRPVITTTPKNDNVYITNGKGVTEYYITPDGRKIYL